MQQFKALSPQAEISGRSLLGILGGLVESGPSQDEAVALLAKAGVLEPEPEGWYSQQAILTVLSEVAKRWGAEPLRSAGRAVPVTARFPPEIESLERALLTLDIAYQVNHRGGRIGHYACKPVGPMKMELFCDNPYCCELDQGILERLVERHGTPGTRPSITHAPGTDCRKDGARACIFLIVW